MTDHDTTPPGATLECVGGPRDGELMYLMPGIRTMRVAVTRTERALPEQCHIYVRDGDHLQYVGASEGW